MEKKIEKMALSSRKGLELKKHVAVIHSSNKLTLLQRKIANALLFNAYKELENKDEHAIHIAKLCEIIGYDSHDHKRIKQALVNLISTVLEWNLVDGERLEGEGTWNASSIIAGASIDGPMCTYSYSLQMRRLLYRPHVYGRLDMYAQSRFQSTYGLALYENCNRFQDIGQTPWFNLEKFRKLMGVADGKYKIFRDFKTRVLDKAVEEVNKYSSLFISAQLRKQNRQVVSIQFLIKKLNPASSDHIENNEAEKKGLADILKEFGFSVKQVTATIQQYEEQYIKEKIKIVQVSPSFRNDKVKNRARYLLSALKNDYQPGKNSLIDDAPHPNFRHDDVITQTQFRRFQEMQLFGLFNALPERSKAKLIKKFEKFLVGMYYQLYLRDGLKNILIQEQLCFFLQQIKHQIVQQLTPYDAWVAEKSKA